MFQNPGDAIWPGWGGMAARALIETPEGKKRYIARLKEMTAKNFKLEDIYKKIDAVVPRAKEAMESVQKGKFIAFLKPVKGRKSVKWEKLAKDMIGKLSEADLAKYTEEGEPSVRLEIRKVE